MGILTIIEGDLVREPEIRYERSGRAKTLLGVRTSETQSDQDTEESFEPPVVFDVVCRGDLAENVALSLEKGTSVIVVGRLIQRSWENEAGELRSKIEIEADNVGASLTKAVVEVSSHERSRSSSL